ncbi:MAG: Asp23/Gls24 family envelope stress response protein [Oscillospiraceae bacterium]|nr:Asp23/Gls24 family envelope stress response protein [Oscillospiraceae bacterium]
MVKLKNEQGAVNIKKAVFTTLTGDAATNCFGVKGMTVRSVSDGLVHMLKPEFMGKGVHVNINPDNTITIMLHIAVDQGVNIPVVCESIKDEVRYKVTSKTGVEIKRIDVFVDKMIIG